MKSNELRISNYIYVKGSDFGKIGYVVGITPAFIEVRINGVYQSFNIDEIEPIELTPEILEKAGGKNKGGWVGYFYEAEIYGEDVRIVWQLMGGRLSVFANDNLIKHEESPAAHSFQNSVYYLTGEELPLTL